RLPLQAQNAVMAPLISQIYSYRQPVSIGGRRMPATWFCLRCVLLRRFCPEPFRQLRHQLCHHFLGIPLHWASGLHPFRVPFTLLLRIAILLQGSISSPENPERGDVADRGDPITLRVPGILCAPAFPGASPSAW